MSAMRLCARPCGRLRKHLNALIAEQQRAEEEQASQQLMRAIQRAFHEALLALPPEEYDWFDVQRALRIGGANARRSGENGKAPGLCRRIKCWARPNRSPRQSHSASSSSTQDRSSVSLSRPRRARLP